MRATISGDEGRGFSRCGALVSGESCGHQFCVSPFNLCWHRGMRATISGDEGKGFLKLIVAKDTDKLVGAHFVGSEVAEIMQASCSLSQHHWHMHMLFTISVVWGGSVLSSWPACIFLGPGLRLVCFCVAKAIRGPRKQLKQHQCLKC